MSAINVSMLTLRGVAEKSPKTTQRFRQRARGELEDYFGELCATEPALGLLRLRGTECLMTALDGFSTRVNKCLANDRIARTNGAPGLLD